MITEADMIRLSCQERLERRRAWQALAAYYKGIVDRHRHGDTLDVYLPPDRDPSPRPACAWCGFPVGSAECRVGSVRKTKAPDPPSQ